MMNHISWRRLFALLCFLPCYLQAFEFGGLRLPQAVEPLRLHLLQSPHRCIEQAQSMQSADVAHLNLTPEQRINQLAAQQLGALCHLQLEHYSQAETLIDASIHASIKLQDYTYQLQGQLIKALILSEQSQRQDDTLRALEQSQVLIEKLKSFPISNLRFQLHRIRANYYFNIGQPNAAKNQLLEAKSQAYNLPSAFAKARAEYLFGILSLKTQQTELALTHFNEALDLVKKDPRKQSRLLSSLANQASAKVYWQQKQIDIAISYQKNAISDSQEVGRGKLIAEQIATLGDMEIDNQHPDLALNYYLNAADLAQAENANKLSADISFRLGYAHSLNGDYAAALLHLELARKQFQLQSRDNAKLRVLLELGRLHSANNENGLAILQLQRAEALASEQGLSHEHANIYQSLSRAYENTGDFKQALAKYKTFQTLQKRIHRNEVENQRQSGNERFQFIEQALQLSNMSKEKAELQRQSRQHQLLIGILSVGLLLTVMVFANARQRLFQQRQHNKELDRQLAMNPITGWRQLQYNENPIALLDKPSHDNDENNEKLLAILTIKRLDTLSQQVLGQAQRRSLYHQLIDTVLQPELSSMELGHLGDKRFLILQRLNEHSTQQLCESWLQRCEEFASKNQLNIDLTIGCCKLPFLEKTNHAIEHHGLFEIVSMAHEAAEQLAQRNNYSVWLELSALSTAPAAFFGLDINHDVKHAIAQGIVKVNSNYDKNAIQW